MTDTPKQSPLASPEPWSLVADDYTLELLPMFELFSRDALALVPTVYCLHDRPGLRLHGMEEPSSMRRNLDAQRLRHSGRFAGLLFG